MSEKVCQRVHRESSLPLRIRVVIRCISIREEEACRRGIVDSTLVLLESGIQGETKPFCMFLCEAEDCTLECAGVCLAGGPHPLCNLRINE